MHLPLRHVRTLLQEVVAGVEAELARKAIDGDVDAALVLVDTLQQLGDKRGKQLQSPVFWVRMKALLSFMHCWAGPIADGVSANLDNLLIGHVILRNEKLSRIDVKHHPVWMPGFLCAHAFFYNSDAIALISGGWLCDENGMCWRNGTPGNDLISFREVMLENAAAWETSSISDAEVQRVFEFHVQNRSNLGHRVDAILVTVQKLGDLVATLRKRKRK